MFLKVLYRKIKKRLEEQAFDNWLLLPNSQVTLVKAMTNDALFHICVKIMRLNLKHIVVDCFFEREVG